MSLCKEQSLANFLYLSVVLFYRIKSSQRKIKSATLNIIRFSNIFYFLFIYLFFFLSGFSFTYTDNSQDSREGRGPSYSILKLPPAHEHSDIYLQLCTWDDYHIFLFATLVFTRLLLDEIYHLIELLFDWLMT